jgi:hypothetical protein
VLKKWISVSSKPISHIINSINQIVQTQYTTIKHEIMTSSITVPAGWLPDWFYYNVKTKISSFSLLQIADQYKKAVDITKKEECTNEFTTTMGLPCYHRLREMIKLNRPLSMSDINYFWNTDIPYEIITNFQISAVGNNFIYKEDPNELPINSFLFNYIYINL